LYIEIFDRDFTKGKMKLRDWIYIVRNIVAVSSAKKNVISKNPEWKVSRNSYEYFASSF